MAPFYLNKTGAGNVVSYFIRRFTRHNADNVTVRRRVGFICGAVGIFFNTLLFAAKLFAGLITGTISVVADAFNNLTDAASSAVTTIGFSLSGRRADTEHPFGHGRIEYISGVFISVAIIFIGIELLRSSVREIFSPSDTAPSPFMIPILIASVAIKLYMAAYNKKWGKKIGSSTLLAAAADSLGDCGATSAVLLSYIVDSYTGLSIDGYAGAIVSILIIKGGIDSVISTSSPLLGHAPDPEFVHAVERIVLENPETVGIHDLVVHDYGPGKIFVSLHMEVDGHKDVYELHDAVDLTERRIAEELDCEAIIHMDPIDVGNPMIDELFRELSSRAAQIGPGIRIHDVRLVPGVTHTNVIFEAAIPPDLFRRRDEIGEALQSVVKEINESYVPVMQIEHSYDGGA